MTDHVPTYWDYLSLDKLLSLQNGLEENEDQLPPDELHFIVIHQTLELWFKLALSELRLARDHMSAVQVPEQDIPLVVHHLGRIIEIIKLGVQQFDVVETLTARDFLGFRDKLFPASGFQSHQLREIEVLLGIQEEDRVTLGQVSTMDYLKDLAKQSPGGAVAWGRIEKAREEVSLRSALHDWLYRCPINGSSPGDQNDREVVRRFLADYLEAWNKAAESQIALMVSTKAAPEEGVRARYASSRAYVASFLEAHDVPENLRDRVVRIRAAAVFVESYRELPLLAWPRRLLDTAVELEERLVIFRQRHARMAERIIGRRVGTGGSDGVDYLDRTSKNRIFKDLWAIRTVLLEKNSLPPLENEEFYNFKS